MHRAVASPKTHPLILKLRQGAALRPEDDALISAGVGPSSSVAADVDLLSEAERPGRALIILEGFACRFRQLENGTRQIVALLVPGDLCTTPAAVMREIDQGISTLGGCRVAYISRRTLAEWTTTSPAISEALRWSALVDEATSQEWLVSLTARSAMERTAHLLCEVRSRLEAVSVGPVDAFAFPLSQERLGQLLGICKVHLNRTLRSLEREGLVRFKRGFVSIEQADQLAAIAGFSDDYLRLRSAVSRGKAAAWTVAD